MTTMPAGASLRQRREATVREYIDAENRHDPDGVVATFSHTRASYDVPALGEAGQPADAPAVRAMWVGLITSFPDIHNNLGVQMSQNLLEGVDIRGLDLRKVRGLNRQQIDLAIGDHTTQLPDYLLVPRA